MIGIEHSRLQVEVARPTTKSVVNHTAHCSRVRDSGMSCNTIGGAAEPVKTTRLNPNEPAPSGSKYLKRAGPLAAANQLRNVDRLLSRLVGTSISTTPTTPTAYSGLMPVSLMILP